MRKHLRKFLPDHEAIRANRWLAPFENTLLHPRLWHLNRHSAAGGAAVGLFCGLIPGPFQMLGAAIGAVAFRVNLPLALLTTLYTNPLTIVPLYFFEYWLGCKLLGLPLEPFSFEMSHDWFINHLLPVWKPFVLGSIVTSLVVSLVGYVVLGLLWHLSLVLKYHKRKNAG